MSASDKRDIDPASMVRVRTPPASNGFAIDDIMWKVRAEVTRRREGFVTDVMAPPVPAEVRPFDLSIPKWRPAIPRLPMKDRYQLAELLAFWDVEFIDSVFQAILRRPPDEHAFNHYLHKMRHEGMSRTAVLMEFLSTGEAQAIGVVVDGLSMPALLEKWRSKKIIGPIVVWVHALLRLGNSTARYATLEMNHAREMQEVGRLLNESSEYLLQRIVALKVELGGRVGAAEFEALKREHEAASARISELTGTVERKLRDSAFIKSQLSNLEAEVRARLKADEEHINGLRGNLDHAVTSIQQILPGDRRGMQANRALDPFYAAFEEHFRGDRAVIRTRVEPYLALVLEVGAGTLEAPVVDIGCGRGEWLELLRDNGMIARGVDSNRVFIEQCRDRGLEVVEGDAIAILSTMPDGSAGAITSMHLIEHLPFERAVVLLDEVRRVLRPGGLIILETPNPENLTVGHHWFYMDPTHRNPLPPESLRWIVEARGFNDVRIERLTTARPLDVPPPLSNDIPGADAVNILIASMSAAPDYAIVGKRP